MANIRQLRTRIKSIKTIQQITRAMKMVASARLHKSQSQLLEARPYAFEMQAVIRDLAQHICGQPHFLLRENPGTTEALMVLTSDKGLCAGFNVHPLQRAGRALAAADDRHPVEVLSVGRKGSSFFRRVGVKPFREWAGFWQDLNWYHADSIGQEIIEAFQAGRWTRLTLVYNRFKSMMAQETVQETLLPVALECGWKPGKRDYGEYDFEPAADEVFDYLLPRYVKNALWHALLESKAAELAARMQAMDNATQSASDMISELTLQMNRARQAAITREIAELVSGAEAINV